jgi:ABC-type transport system involved in multi-copper enzyme maturation permease subunit
MIWHVARRELLEHVRSARFVALCGLALLLLPLSAHVNASRYHARIAQTAELRSAQQRKVAEPVTESGQYASRYGWRDGELISDPALRAVRGPSRFAVLALGAEGALPAYWQFGTEGVEPGPSAITDGGATGDGMDAVFIVQSVLGLLALLLVFDAVSGERESGVLRLLLASPVRRSDLLFGKALGALATLAVPLVLGVAGALLVLEVRDVSLVRQGGVARVGLFLAGSALYLLHMVALGLAVSAATSRPKSSWVALLLIWIGMVLVIPRAADMLAATVHPVPPPFESRQAKAAAIRQLQHDRARTLSSVWRRAVGSDTVPGGAVERPLRDAYRRIAMEQERAYTARKRAVIRQVELERQRAIDRQARVARAVGRVSPAAAYATVAADLAGTGSDAASRWSDQVASHQARLEAATFDRTFGMELYPASLGYLRVIWWPDLADPSDRPPAYEALPAFAYREAPLLDIVEGVLPELAMLAVGSALWMVVALTAFQRLNVH